MDALLLEASPVIGGLQRRSPYENVWVPGVPGKTGQEIAAAMQAHLDAVGVRYMTRTRVQSIQQGENSWRVACEGGSFQGRRIVIATGSSPRAGGFHESDRVGIGPGLSMERLDVVDKRVAILGGGDNAFDQAAFAMRRGARIVDVYCRREPRAQRLLQRKVPLRSVHVGTFEADQRSMTVNGIRYDVFGVQFGFEPNRPDGLSLPSHHGFVDVDRQGAVAGFPGLFAAGEVTNYWHPCVSTSYAHGVQVAKSIQRDLQGT
jgi:thioredoxin reductase